MPIITTDGSGKTQVTTTSGNQITLNPQETRRDNTQNKRYPLSPISSRFKLVTVRRLTNYTAEDLNTQIANSYKQLEAAALRTGQPVPYPTKPVTVVDAKNIYGVFIDEDLYGCSAPVYTFIAASAKVKCFITTSGAGKDDWSVHIAHSLEKTVNQDNTFTTRWRLVSVDSDVTGRTYYVLEDNALPECFHFNFDIDAINYIGGGTWTAMAVDRSDRIPIYAITAADNDRYIKVGRVYAAFGESRARSLVAYSMTPTYVFTWQRGSLVLKKRQREASQDLDIGKLTGDGVISFTRQHSYNLDIPYRVENKANKNDISAVIITEYSKGKATYVGNTNAPGIASQFQNPDYGTDKRRLSVSNIQMNTNIIRPTNFEYTYQLVENRISRCPLGYAPVLCASPDMSVFLKHDFGEATGRVDHPYEIKRTPGSRGFQYGEDYKLWWGYGRVIETYPYGDTGRYRRLKNPGFDAAGVRLPDRVKIGSMFDLGELRKSTEHPNAVETTWNAYVNPPTGFFGLEEGTLSFWVVYLNPPIIGHQGVYYYHINPPLVGAGSGSYELDEFGVTSGDRFNQNILKYIYSQMLGGLGGGGLNSIDIGDVTIAANDSESIIVREPNSTQKAALLEAPETFPASYFDGDTYSFTLKDDNQGQIVIYDSKGVPQQTYAFS